MFLIVVVLLNALRLWAPWLHNVPTNPLEELAAGGPMNAAMFALVAIFAGGVREELQRAFLLHRFEQHLGGARVGVIVLSVAFGLGHFVQGWDAAITTGTLGAFWAVLYLRRRSSVAPSSATPDSIRWRSCESRSSRTHVRLTVPQVAYGGRDRIMARRACVALQAGHRLGFASLSSLNHEVALLAAGGDYFDLVTGRARRSQRVAQIVFNVVARHAQLAREP